MRARAALLFALVGAIAAAAPAPGQHDRPRPSFDCAAAGNRVQRTICNSVDLSELDRDVARFMLALQTSMPPDQARAIAASQAQWGRYRDSQCNRVIGETDPDGPVYRCLMGIYRLRFLQLAEASDKLKGGRARGSISGFYRFAEAGTVGEMWIYEWPEATVTVIIDTLTLPDAPTCALRLDLPRTGPEIEGGPSHARECRVNIAVEGRIARVSSSSCQSVCVLNGRVDGTYRR